MFCARKTRRVLQCHKKRCASTCVEICSETIKLWMNIQTLLTITHSVFNINIWIVILIFYVIFVYLHIPDWPFNFFLAKFKSPCMKVKKKYIYFKVLRYDIFLLFIQIAFLEKYLVCILKICPKLLKIKVI